MFLNNLLLYESVILCDPQAEDLLRIINYLGYKNLIYLLEKNALKVYQHGFEVVEFNQYEGMKIRGNLFMPGIIDYGISNNHFNTKVLPNLLEALTLSISKKRDISLQMRKNLIHNNDEDYDALSKSFQKSIHNPENL